MIDFEGRALMVEGKDFDGEVENLDNSSASDDGETSADAEANLKIKMVLVMDRGWEDNVQRRMNIK